MTKKTRTAILAAVAGAVAARELCSMLTLFVKSDDGDEAVDLIAALTGAEPSDHNILRDKEGVGGTVIRHWYMPSHLSLQVQYKTLPADSVTEAVPS